MHNSLASRTKQGSDTGTKSSQNSDEQQLPSTAAVIHEQIRHHGEQELNRDAMALLLSAIAAGLSMGLSLLVKALLAQHVENLPGGILIEHLGYCVGFVVVIIAQQQLFTENTITAVLPVMQHPRRWQFLRLIRLWTLVLMGNFIGTALAALAFIHWPVFDPQLQQQFHHISEESTLQGANVMFFGALCSGWLVATMVWMFPYAGQAKILVIVMITWIMSLAGMSHIVVGSVEAFYLTFTDSASWTAFFWPFAIPTLAGNITGGTLIFALLSHVQIRSDRTDSQCN